MSNHYTFVGGTLGPWEVASMTPVRGEGLDPAAQIEVVNTRLEALPAGASWALRGVTSCNAPLLWPRQRLPTTSGIFHTFLVNYVTVTGARSR